MDMAEAILQDDLLLCTLLCSKLALRIKGIYSVGLAALNLECPMDFFRGRDTVVSALIEVLRSLALKPGFKNEANFWLHQSAQIGAQWKEFYGSLEKLADWRNMTEEEIQKESGVLISKYLDLVQTLQTLAESVGMKVAYLEESRTLTNASLGFLTNLGKHKEEETTV